MVHTGLAANYEAARKYAAHDWESRLPGPKFSLRGQLPTILARSLLMEDVRGKCSLSIANGRCHLLEFRVNCQLANLPVEQINAVRRHYGKVSHEAIE